MLDKVDLNRRLAKEEYKSRIPALQRRLFDLHRACWNAGLATGVVFEGWDAAGKGAAIRKLTERLEPRGFALHSVRAPRSHELRMPWLYRCGRLGPNHGGTVSRCVQNTTTGWPARARTLKRPGSSSWRSAPKPIASTARISASA